MAKCGSRWIATLLPFLLATRQARGLDENVKKYCHWLKQFETLSPSEELGPSLPLTVAEEQFNLASVMSFCSQGYADNEDDRSKSHQWYDDFQHVLEFASSFALKPGSLLASARRVSCYSEACFAGLKFMEPASFMNSFEHFERPSSQQFRVSDAPPKGYLGVNEAIQQTYRPLASVEWNHLSDVVAELSRQQGGDYRVTMPSAHRFLMGGDRFPQSYSMARKLFVKALKDHVSEDVLGFLAMMAWKGLGTARDKSLAVRLSILSLSLYNDHNALNVLAVALMDMSRTRVGRNLIRQITEEENRILEKGLDDRSGVMNAVSLDLLFDNPMRMRLLISLSNLISTGDPVILHTLAKLTSSNFLGMHTCIQSWNLMAKAVRRNLWFSAASNALSKRGRKTTLTDLELMRLATAGVEEAEWSLSQLPSIRTQLRAKLRLLSFSAHRGRVTSQLKLAIASDDKALRRMRGGQRRRPSRDRRRVSDPRDKLLSVWNVGDSPKPVPFSPEELVYTGLDFVVKNRLRWVAFEDDPVPFVIASAEAVTKLAWMSFLGTGVDQNLQESLKLLSRLTTNSPYLFVMENVYYFLFQMAFTANWILLHTTSQVQFACAVVLVSSLFWLLRSLTRKRSQE